MRSYVVSAFRAAGIFTLVGGVGLAGVGPAGARSEDRALRHRHAEIGYAPGFAEPVMGPQEPWSLAMVPPPGFFARRETARRAVGREDHEGAAAWPPAVPGFVPGGFAMADRGPGDGPARWGLGGGPSRGGQSGMASYYWEPQRTATGERFNPNAMTAAHRSLPFGTMVRVTNRRNGSVVHVRINDRGPFVRGRIIDLSRAAATRIGMTSTGVAPVTVQVVD